MKKLWNRDFILLLQGNAVSTIGDMMYSVAIGYWVYENTGSSGLMGIMSSVSMFVSMFLMPFSGSLADKCSRKRLLVGIDVIQGIVMLCVGLLAYTNRLSVPIVIIAAFLASVGSAFYGPAVSTLRLDVIPHDDMVRGQSVFSGVASIIDMTGNAFSGVMVAFFGVPLIVILNGLSNLYSAFTELFINVPETVGQGEEITVKGVLGDIRQAVGVIFSHECLKLFVPCSLLINLLASGSFSLLLPFCMEKGFTVDMYGYLLSVFTAASLACVLLLSILKLKPRTRYRVMILGYMSFAALIVAFFLSNRFIPMCVLVFAASFGMCAGNTVFNASLMLALPDENRGAILGFMSSASVGGCALSAVIYGLLGEIFPLYLVFTAGSLLSVVPMAFTFFNRRTREFMLEH